MKFFKHIILVFFLQITLFAKRDCSELLVKYNIDYNIKSYSGWMRACKNDKIYLYIKIKITPEEKDAICNCFYYDYKDKDFYRKDRE